MTYNDINNFCNTLQAITEHMSIEVFEGLIATTVHFWCKANNKNETDILLDILNHLKYIDNDSNSLTFPDSETIR